MCEHLLFSLSNRMNTPKSAVKAPGTSTPLSSRKTRQSVASRASTANKNPSSVQKNPRHSRFLRPSQLKRGDNADADNNISLSVLADFDDDQLSTNITAQDDQTMDLADDSVMDESLIKIDNGTYSQIDELIDKNGFSDKTIVFSNGNDSMDITSQYKPAAKPRQSTSEDQNMSIDMDLTTEVPNDIPASPQRQTQTSNRLSVRRSPRGSIPKRRDGNLYNEAELDVLAARKTTPRKSNTRKEPTSAKKSARMSVTSSANSQKSAIRSTFQVPELRHSHASTKSSAKQGRLSVGEDTYEIKSAATSQKQVEESTGDWLNPTSTRFSQLGIDSLLQQTSSWDTYEDTHSIQDDMSMDISISADAPEEPTKDSTGNYPTASTDELQGALDQIEQVRNKIVEERKAQDPLKTPTKNAAFVPPTTKTPSSIRKSFIVPDSAQTARSRRSLLFSTPRRNRMPSLKGMIADVGSKVPILASASKKVDQKARRASMILQQQQQQQQQQQGKSVIDLNTSTNKWVDELMNEVADETLDLNKSPRLNKAIENIAYVMSPRSKKRRESLSELKPDMPFARSPVAARGLSLSKFLSVIRSSLPSLEEQKKAAKELITPDEKEKQDFALLEIPSIRNTAEEFLAIKLKTAKDALESLRQRTELLQKETETLEVTFDQRSKKEGSALASYLQALSEDTETVSRLFKQSSMRAFEEGMRLATSINDVVDTEADHLCEKLNADLITARQRLNALRKERIQAEESLAEQVSFRSAKEIIVQLLQNFKDVKRRSTLPRPVKSKELSSAALPDDEQAKQDVFNRSLFLQAMTPWKIVAIAGTHAKLMFADQFTLDLNFELVVEEKMKRRRVSRKSAASADTESYSTLRLVVHDALFSPNRDLMIEPYFNLSVRHEEIQRDLILAKQRGELDVQLRHLTTFLVNLRRSMKEIAIVRKTLPIVTIEPMEVALREERVPHQSMRMTLRPKELPAKQNTSDVIIRITFSNVFPLNRITVGLVYHVGPRIEFYDLKVTRGSIKEETIKELVASHPENLCGLCAAIVKCVETSSNKTLFGKIEKQLVINDIKTE